MGASDSFLVVLYIGGSVEPVTSPMLPCGKSKETATFRSCVFTSFYEEVLKSRYTFAPERVPNPEFPDPMPHISIHEAQDPASHGPQVGTLNTGLSRPLFGAAFGWAKSVFQPSASYRKEIQVFKGVAACLKRQAAPTGRSRPLGSFQSCCCADLT